MPDNDVIINEDEIFKSKDLDKILMDLLSENVSENVTIINKKLQLSDTTDSIVKKSLKKFYNSREYGRSLTDFVTKVEDISKYKLDSYKKEGLTVSPSEINLSQKIAIDEHLSYLNENGLNNRFNQPLRKIIYSNVYAGKSQNQLESELKSFVTEKESLSRYVKQTAIQGADAYTSIIDQKITDKYVDNVVGYTMVGSLIESSSPQCKYCVEKLKRKIKKDDWENIKEIALQNGLIEGTEFTNIPTNKLHWGCRHQFTPNIE